MNNNLQENFKLLVNYNTKLTLTENKQLNEDAIGKEIASIVAKDGKLAISDVAKNWLRELPSVKGQNFESFLKGFGGLSKEAKQAFVGDLLKNTSTMRAEVRADATVASLIDKASESLSKQLASNGTELAREFNAAGGKAQQKLFLKKKGYRPDVIEKVMGGNIVKDVGVSKNIKSEIEVGKNIKSETELGKLKTQKGKWEGFKKLARMKGLKVLEYAKKLGWKKIIMYGAAGWLAIYLWRNWFSAKPKLWSQCLIDFVGYNNFSKAVQIKPGILSVKGKTGLQSLDMNGYTYFRNDGTAKNGQFEGTWECDGEKLVLEFDGQEYYPVKGSVTPVVTDGGVGGGNSTTDGGGAVTQPTYRACSGTYNKGCKSEVIRKVQGCLGVKMDGLFGPKTEAAVQSKLGKLIFSDSDVDGICGIAQITTTPTLTPTPTPVGEPKLVEPESVASVDDFLKGF